MNNEVAFADPAAINAGSGPLTFEPGSTSSDETTFSDFRGVVVWQNPLFKGGSAIFAMDPTTSLLEIFYSGAVPANYQVLTLFIVLGDSVDDGQFYLLE